MILQVSNKNILDHRITASFKISGAQGLQLGKRPWIGGTHQESEGRVPGRLGWLEGFGWMDDPKGWDMSLSDGVLRSKLQFFIWGVG